MQQGTCPRYAYTIGLNDPLGLELVLAGAIFFDVDEVNLILHSIRNLLGKKAAALDSTLEVPDLGSFTLRHVDSSWAKLLLLGASDYYGRSAVDAYQIVPDALHWTIDVPNLSTPSSESSEPIWRWLHVPWQCAFPSTLHVATDLEALQGARITQATRWEDNYWEMFAGPVENLSPDRARIVPLGCLVAHDPSLKSALDLEIGQRILRDSDGGDWIPSRNNQGGK